MRTAFSSLHPLVVFSFFVGAIILCVIVQHPLYQFVGLLASVVLYVTIRGRSGWKMALGMMGVIAALTLINPLFNTRGDTVLFLVFGRPFTLQAMAYGLSTGIMFATMLLWFASYSRMVTSDRFTYLFGGMAPAFTLVLTMALRLVPSYQRKATQISIARRCIGRSAFDGSLGARIENGASVLSALTTWALEGGVTMADSMRARGYGVGRRSSFARYRFGFCNGSVFAILLASFLVACICIVGGAASIEYIPAIVLPPWGAFETAGFTAFSVFVFIPSIVNAREAAVWRFSISRN